MNYFDIMISIPLIWGVYKGFKKGFIIEIASFIALGLGIYGGIKFSAISAEYLSKMFEVSDKMMPLISFAVTFVVIVIAVFALAKMLQKIVTMVALGIVNRIAGAVFGMLKFGLIISVILNVVSTINTEVAFIDSEMEETSLLYRPISQVAPIIIPAIKNLDLNSVVEKATSAASADFQE